MKSLAEDVLYVLQSFVIFLLENEHAKTYRSMEYPLKKMQHSVLDVMIGRLPFFYVAAHGVDSYEAKLFHAAKSLGISEQVLQDKMTILASKFN